MANENTPDLNEDYELEPRSSPRSELSETVQIINVSILSDWIDARFRKLDKLVNFNMFFLASLFPTITFFCLYCFGPPTSENYWQRWYIVLFILLLLAIRFFCEPLRRKNIHTLDVNVGSRSRFISAVSIIAGISLFCYG